MKSKLNKAIEMTEHELQKMPNEQRKHIEVLLQAAKLLPTFFNSVVGQWRLTSLDCEKSGGKLSEANELIREQTPEEVT